MTNELGKKIKKTDMPRSISKTKKSRHSLPSVHDYAVGKCIQRNYIRYQCHVPKGKSSEHKRWKRIGPVKRKPTVYAMTEAERRELANKLSQYSTTNYPQTDLTKPVPNRIWGTKHAYIPPTGHQMKPKY